MDISQIKDFGNIKSHKLVNTNLCDFIGFYFGIFADSYEFYCKLKEYYKNLEYSSTQIDEIFEDFCNNLNKKVCIKMIKIYNIYIYSFVLENTKYYEFESINEFK